MKTAAIFSLGMFLLLGLSTSSAAQEKVYPDIEKFDFKGLSTFSILPFAKLAENEKKTQVESVRIENVNVKIATYQLRKPAFVVTELCGRTDSGDYGAEREPDIFYRVRTYMTYSLQKHVFAYEVNYEYFDAESGQELGVGVAGIYVDLNGSGQFSLNCTYGETEIKKLPGWVKALRK